MKKLSLFLKTLLAVVVLLAMASCNKEQTNAELAQGEATLARIMDFKQQMDYYKANPAVKDGETMTLDEAIWNIEALFNLTYAYPELSYGHTVTADTVLYLPVGAGNTVLLTDLTVFYGQMYDVVRSIYQGIELDNKQFLILDVEAGSLNGGQQAIKLHSVQGSVKGAQPEPVMPQMWEPFEEGYLWYYGEDGGNTANSNTTDAADTLSYLLQTLLVDVAPNGFEYFYTGLILQKTEDEYFDQYLYPYSQYPEIILRYCEFHKENPTSGDYWIVSYRMNYHYLAEKYLILNILPSQYAPVPSGHYLCEVLIQEYKKSNQQSSIIIGHTTNAYYGHRDIIGHEIVIKGNL